MTGVVRVGIAMDTRTRTRRSVTVECVVWCLAYLLMAGLTAWKFAPSYTNDSYQYLSEADNIVHGHGLETSIVFYDIERQYDRVPAPLTTFPPGYPLAISLFSRLGFNFVATALTLSMLSCAAAFALVMALGIELHLDWIAIRAALAVVLFNSGYAEHSIAVLSEGLFTGLLFAAMFFYVRSAVRDRPKWSDWLAAGIFLSMAVWTRYAGIFILAGVTVYAALAGVMRRGRGLRQALFSLVLPFGSLAALLIRNQLVAGNWRGGSGGAARITAHPVVDFAKNFVPLIYHSLFGDNTKVHLGVAEACLGASAAVLIALAFLALSRGATPVLVAKSRAFWLLTAVLIVYSALLVYNVVKTAIFYTPRYFMPLLPLFALALAIALDWFFQSTERAPALRKGAIAALLMLGVCYAALNLKNLNAFTPNDVHNGIAAILKEPTAQGGSLQQWVNLHVTPDSVVVASSGQATGYEWGRKTVSLAQAPFSNQPWTEQTVHNVMRRYHAPWVVVYRDTSYPLLDAEEMLQSPFLRNLSGNRIPGWLEPAVASQHALVFHLKE